MVVRQPQIFNTFIGNQVSNIVESVSSSCWHRVSSSSIPADLYFQRRMFPMELNQQRNGGIVLFGSEVELYWPSGPDVMEHLELTEEQEVQREIVLTVTQLESPILNKVSNVTCLRESQSACFTSSTAVEISVSKSSLTSKELLTVEKLWPSSVQQLAFGSSSPP